MGVSLRARTFYLAFAASVAVIALSAAVQAAVLAFKPVILINRLSGDCIANTGSSQIGLQVSQVTCKALTSETWTLNTVTAGYRIVSRLNGLCLTVAGASSADGAAIQQ